jgi:membrane-associated phospholipid phosphatase
VGASLVLCLALAVVVHRGVARRRLRLALVTALLLVPATVAFSRLYRGMHYPTDVAGSVVNATLVLLVTSWAVRRATAGAEHPPVETGRPGGLDPY